MTPFSHLRMRLPACAVVLVGMAACTGAPEDGEGWPLSEIDTADSVQVAADPGSGDGAEDSAAAALADGGSNGSPDLNGGSLFHSNVYTNIRG